jgi:hypothetical protein
MSMMRRRLDQPNQLLSVFGLLSFAGKVERTSVMAIHEYHILIKHDRCVANFLARATAQEPK